MVHFERKVRARHMKERHKARVKAREAVKRARKDRGHDRGLDDDVAVVKKKPRTLESMRDMTDTVLVDPHDAEEAADIARDAALLAGRTASAQSAAMVTESRRETKICVTTSPRPSARTVQFAQELCQHVFYHAQAFDRQTFTLDQIKGFCDQRKYTALVVLHEGRQLAHGCGTNVGVTDMYISLLPDGPTAHFGVRGVMLHKEVPDHGSFFRDRDRRLSASMRAHSNDINAELILNNFTTRLGISVAHILQALFNTRAAPDFAYRQVATFHCQRDFIFFRFHRYIFEMAETPLELKNAPANMPITTHISELGPRFTLRLYSVRLGAVDNHSAEYVYLRKSEDTKSRKKWAI